MKVHSSLRHYAPNRWVKRIQAFGLVALLMLAALVVVTASAVSITPRAQPILLEMAAQHPDATIGVIVQKQVKDSTPEAAVARMGGKVTKDLHIINAFAAELRADAVPQLARADGVRWVSFDSPVVKSDCIDCISTTNLISNYVQEIGATRVWNLATPLQGQNIGVAVVDSGVNSYHLDFDTDYVQTTKRIVAEAKFNSFTSTITDGYGHGTHVAGIIGGNGKTSTGQYIGVAPKVNLINVKVSDDRGAGMASDVVSGLQWVLDNRTRFNIRVVNLSLNQSVAESYKTSPIDAAVEILWFNGVVVTVSAGNNGTGNNGNSIDKNAILYPPSNDPFVISVGAIDDRGTLTTKDDSLAPFSAYGYTDDGYFKPDLAAPGINIIAPLADPTSVLAAAHADHQVSTGGVPAYFRMSGTSMSSAVVAGAAALLLQDEPYLTPDQVKYRLMATARKMPSYKGAGAGALDIYAAVNGTTLMSANTGIIVSPLLSTGTAPIQWNSVNWNSVNWNSVNWNSVNWNSVNWNSVNWNSVNWNQ